MARVAPEEFRDLDPDEADLYGLILAASRIPYYFRKNRGRWTILVRERDEERARQAVATYFEENPDRAEPPPWNPPFPGDISGIYAATILAVFHALAGPPDFGKWAMAKQGGAAAGHILSGDLWRCVTALFLHVDAAHLAANMVGIAVFGSAVCQITGYGVGWLLILVAAAGGNYLNAVFHQSHHLAVGASTAVFAALGVLGAIRAAAPWASRISRKSRWVPLAGGFALLAFLGTSADTDIFAHLFGWISGGVAGFAYARLMRFPADSVGQRVCLAVAAAVIAASWAMVLG
ncbi:MAG: rhomboid family intramembrane serine protease [Desulfatibacillaceae bacterium]